MKTNEMRDLAKMLRATAARTLDLASELDAAADRADRDDVALEAAPTGTYGGAR